MTVRLITPPAAEPVTLEMARLHTRAEAVEDDALLTVLITAARQQGEGVTRRVFGESVWVNHIDILPENVHIPDGTVPEDRVSEYCASYDHSVRRIDLMIIGVGEDGQIGFNEPGSYSRSRTRLVQLTYNTRKIQSGAFFGLENTPKMAVTMGIDCYLN